MAKAVLVRPNVAALCMLSSKRSLSSLRGVTVALAKKNNYLSNDALLHVRKSPISSFNGPVWNYRRTFCKGNPISVRIGVNRTYDSTWFSYNSYGKFLSQEILLKSSLQQINPPKSKGKAYGLRVARSILLHYPKRTSISCFVPRKPSQKGKTAKAVRKEKKQKELKIRSQLSRKKSGARDRSAKEPYYTSLFPKQAHSQYQLHRKNQMQFTHLALPIGSTLMESMEKKIKEQLNAESVVVKDTSGDGRHVSINAISSAFEGQSAVDQMTTCTPSEASGK